jgi:hypothetical protein
MIRCREKRDTTLLSFALTSLSSPLILDSPLTRHRSLLADSPEIAEALSPS